MVASERAEQVVFSLRHSAARGQRDDLDATLDLAHTRSRAMGAWQEIVSLTEIFTDDCLATLTRQATHRLADGPRSLVLDDFRSAITTWDNRKRSFNRVHGIAIGLMPSWQWVNAAVYVRNSIAHGGGRLTRLQTRKKALEIATLLRLDFANDEFSLPWASVHDVAERCVSFCLELDQAIGGPTTWTTHNGTHSFEPTGPYA